jgi:NAD(P)-dependent dehydrogenase (short-subunit alcohol dehydrogenase family)
LVNKMEGTRIVLTGAAGGIGAAAALELRTLGARVVGIDARSAEGVIAADVTDAGRIRSAMGEAARLLGGIDTLVNCAGVGVPQDAGGFPDEEAHRVVEVNLFGTWNTTAAAMPELLASASGGHVVNVLSGMAVVDLPYGAAYSASKRALEAYSNTLRLEYAGRLTVTAVYPGYIRTAIHRRSNELGVSLEGVARVETVDQAAAAIVRACRSRRRRVAVTRRSALEFWTARHWPWLVERVVTARSRAMLAERPTPPFLRYPEVPTR